MTVKHDKGIFSIDGVPVINPEVLPNVYYKDNRIHIDGVDPGEDWDLPENIIAEKDVMCGYYNLNCTYCGTCAGDCYQPKEVYRLKLKEPLDRKSCEWNCIRGYCLSFTANYDESRCKHNNTKPEENKEPLVDTGSKETQEELTYESLMREWGSDTDGSEPLSWVLQHFHLTRK